MRISDWSSDVCSSDLGAHMGHGGKVCGEHLRCPFHHWEYNTEGWCKNIPYAKVTPPIVKKQAILRTLPMVEKYGMMWAWYHPLCEAPNWELPYIPEIEDATGYTGSRRGSWTADTRSEEHTSELQSLMRISYAVFCLKQKKATN